MSNNDKKMESVPLEAAYDGKNNDNAHDNESHGNYKNYVEHLHGDQYNKFSQNEEDQLQLETLLKNLPSQRPDDDAKWENIVTNFENIHYEVNFLRLIENKVIFVTSNHNKHSWSITYDILAKPELKNLEKHYLYFPGYESRKYITLPQLIALLKDTKDQFILIDLSNPNKNSFQKRFFESLVSQKIGDDINVLKANNIYISILIRNDIAYKIKDSNNTEFEHNFHIWELSEKVVVSDNNEQEPDLEIIIEKLTHVHKTILYVAAFFDLSFRNYNYVIEILLGAENKQESVTIDLFKNFKREDAKIIKQVITDNALNIWSNYKDILFKQCYLIGDYRNGQYVVNFIYPNHREKVRKYFKEKEHFFWQSQFEIIESQGLFFNPRINTEVSEGIVSLMIESLSDDPEYYDDDWFRRMIRNIKNFEGQAFILEGETEEEQNDNLFWEFVNRHGLADFFYRRLADILEKMFLTDNLNSRVDDYLRTTMNFGHHDVLLRIVKRLSPIVSFGKFYWAKQLIERSRNEIKIETYQWLVNYLSQKYPEETWIAINSWLPKDKKLINYSPSNHYSSFFIAHFYVNEINKFPLSSYGTWPNQYSLFANDQNNIKDPNDHLQFILDKVFHEGVEYQFSTKNSSDLVYFMTLEVLATNWAQEKTVKNLFIDSDNNLAVIELNYSLDYSTLLADIIEAWYHILKGYGEQYHKNAKALNKFILATIAGKIQDHPAQVNAIIKHWQNKPGIYDQLQRKLQEYRSGNENELTEKELKVIDELTDSMIKRMRNFTYFFDELNKALR